MLPPWFDSALLWLVLDEAAAAPRTMLEAAGLGLEGGVDAVVFRHRNAPAAEVLGLGLPIRELCREHGAPFILSHYPELASELKPDAVQLGVIDAPLDAVRALVGHGCDPASLCLGFSAHSVGEAEMKLGEGYDYCFLGPVFATPEKLKFGPPLGLSVVEEAASLAGRLVFIGGIDAGNVSEVLAAGGKRVAVISAILRQTNPQASAAELKRLLRMRE